MTRPAGFRIIGLAALATAGAMLLVCALTILAGITWPDPFGWLGEWSYNLVEWAVVAACAARALHTRRNRGAWLALSAGLASYAAADMYWIVVLGDMENVPYPSLGDALYLGFYPAALVALALLGRDVVGRFAPSVWLDGLIGALGVAAVGGALVFPVVLAQTGGPASTVLTNLAYPLGDALLLALVFGVVGLSGWRPGRSWVMLAIGLGLFAVFDTIYLYQTANGTYVENTVVDIGWPTALVVLALAAWLPAGRAHAARLEGWTLLAVPMTVGLAGLAVLVYDHFHPSHAVAVLLAAGAVLAVLARLGMTFAEHLAMLAKSQHEAHTDALTGLGNRRALMRDLDLQTTEPEGVVLLALFDLDGFKPYNDTFGHPAGDALLARLGERLRSSVEPAGAYRMGGDEFCVLGPVADVSDAACLLEAASAALCETGEMFTVAASYGMVLVPEDARGPVEALRLADQRMYDHKALGRPSAARQAVDVLVRAVRARDDALDEHGADVAALAARVASAMQLPDRDQEQIVQAAQLHDVGKLAMPEQILSKPTPLDADEWRFMRRHSEIGQRIVGESGNLAPVGVLIRASHERWDGQGYPDRLSGDAIPLGSRIIAVCDAYDAMTHSRPYAPARSASDALVELQLCAGTQFDPAVVACFCAVMRAQSDRAA